MKNVWKNEESEFSLILEEKLHGQKSHHLVDFSNFYLQNCKMGTGLFTKTELHENVLIGQYTGELITLEEEEDVPNRINQHNNNAMNTYKSS